MYDDEVAKSIAKWVSRLEVQMKAQVFDPTDPVL